MTRLRVGTTIAWIAATAAIAYSVWAGRRLQVEGPEIFLGAAPLVGQSFSDGWDWRFGWGLIGAAAIAGVLVWLVGSGRWWLWPYRVVLAVTATGAAAFAVMLAATDGRAGLLRGADHPTEYLANLEIAPPPLELIESFVEDLDRYSVHVRGHPPGFVVLLQGLDSIALGGAWPVAALSVIATTLLPLGVLTAVRAQGGDDWARSVAPALIVSPYALWMVTSADAVFTAIAAWSVASLVLGLKSHGRRSFAWGAASGALVAALLFMTYGGATFAIALIVPIAVAIRTRAPGTATAVASGLAIVGLVTASFAALGFWWLDGARETQSQYWAGTAQFRPFGYFAVANIAVALIAIGPLGFAGLLRLWRDRRTVPSGIIVLVAGGLVALLASHASQYSRAEVERIWLLFYPWLMVAAGSILVVSRPRRAAALVGVQAGCAIALQAALVSKW